MRILDLLSENTINLNLNASTKENALDQMISLAFNSGNITDKEKLKEEVFNRESISSTGIGEGIAIPHAKSSCITSPIIAIGVFKEGIEYDSIDGEKVKIIFLLCAPENNDVHLDILSKLSSYLLDEHFVFSILSATSFDEIKQIINDKENQEKETKQGEDYRVLAVTSCPTGIAHTYMAEEALYQAANKMGITIKVETNGSNGVKNKLTDEDIENCEGIIIAADKNVDMERFIGKNVLIVNTKTAIRESEVLIQKIIDKDVSIYKEKETIIKKDKKNDDYSETYVRQIYKHLMNGVSHMLPFVIGGGILIAIAFLIDAKNAGSPDFGSVNEVAKVFKTIGGYAFSFMLPVLSAYIASSIADRPGLAVGFVGGFMATLPEASYIATANNSSAGFLGALVAGFVSGYIVLGLKFLTKSFPKSLDGIKPTLIYPLFGILIIGLLMYFVINAPFAFLNNAISNGLNSLNDVSIVLLGAILAGMMSIDMGGPINKAAYVFGTAAITSGNYAIMAPVMIGGMIPPLVIALATTFFPHKFTKKERTDGKVNYIMGLSFITEGAIPFAASDPWRVILSCVVGSVIAGGLCSFFGCTLMAPHGGIFVLAVIKNPLLYLLSLVIGSVIGMIILGLLKKKVDNPELGKFKGIFNKERR